MSSIDDHVRDQVWDQFKRQLAIKPDADTGSYNLLWLPVWTQVRNQVGNQTWVQLGENS
jgi:hypothetical protein